MAQSIANSTKLHHNGRMKSSASKEAKSHGLKGTAEICLLSGRSRTTIERWYKDDYQLFQVVLWGCVAKKDSGQ